MLEKILSQYSLKKKINLIIIIFAIPLLVIIIIALTLFRARLYDSLHLNNKKSRANVADAITFFKKQTLVYAKMVARNSSVRKAIYFREISKIQKNISPILHETDIDIIVIHNKKRLILADAQNSARFNIPDNNNSALNEALTNNPTFHVSLHGNSIALLTTYPIVHENDDEMIIGAVTIGYHMDRHFAQMVKKLSGTELIFIRDGKSFASSFGTGLEWIPGSKSAVYGNGQLYDLAHIKIKSGTIPNLAIAVAVDNSSIKRTLNATIIITIILIITFSIISLLLTMKIAQHLINSTEAILKGTREIESGVYDTAITLDGNDEFRKLADTFNSMAANIKNNFKEIESAKSKIQLLQHYLSNIINSMPSALIAVDSSLRITHLNKQARQIINPAIDDPVGKSLPKVLPGRLEAIESIQQSITEAKEKIFPGMEQADGSETRFEDITIYPLIADDASGAVIRIDDVTERIHMQEQLNHSRKMDSIGQLAGGIAHDFNNMLTGIIGAAQLLKLPARHLDETGHKFTDIILQSVERASGLIKKLLAFSRRGKTITKALDINAIIKDAAELLKSTIDKRIRITTICEAENHTVIGDASALQNALLNLGINASHAMPNGGEISIRTMDIVLNQTYCNASAYSLQPGEYIGIEVRDSGCGIKPEHLGKIFDPFFTTKDRGKGTGLGLAAVYGTVGDHQGAIEVYSEVGKGTVFRLFLPCATDETIKTKNERIVIQGSGTILLVDDEEFIRITGKSLLEEMGYSVIIAEDGQQALAIFEKQFREIDLVIIDMIMPVMNGTETLREMKKIDRQCKIILSSGFARNEDILTPDQNGFTAFIQKPFRDYEISRIIAEILKS